VFVSSGCGAAEAARPFKAFSFCGEFTGQHTLERKASYDRSALRGKIQITELECGTDGSVRSARVGDLLPSFGQKLKAEREKRSITLDQISLSTKIGTRMLQALEEDKFSQLPGGIFNKGFVRAYARHVGIDEEQAVADYLEAAGETVPPRAQDEPEGVSLRIRLEEDANQKSASSIKSSRELPWGMFAAVLLAVALGLSLWSHRQRQAAVVASPASVKQPAPATDVSRPTGNVNPGNAESPNVVKPAPPARDKDANPAPARLAAAGNTEKKTPSIAPESAPELTSSRAQVDNPKDEITVLIEGREDCWISISADGQTVASYMLSAGTQRTVHGKQSVIIKAGNVGGIDLSFNGMKLAAQGESGEVKTLTFGPEGLQPNTQSPPITQ
jgi:cytoskeleton protein RodZ